MSKHLARFLLRLSLFVAVCARTVALEAQPLPSPLGVEDVARIARSRRQEIAASAARARAAGQRPAVEGSLDQPMVMASLDHLPFALHGADWSVMVQQDFPLSGLLSRRRAAAEASARRQRALVDVTALDVELEAVDALLMLFERRRVGRILEQQGALARALAQASAVRHASGQGAQADVLRAEAESARIDALRLSNAQLTRGAEAMLRAALALPTDTELPEVSLAREESETALPALVSTAFANRPELAAMRAERARAQAEVGVMESMYWPMAFVRLGGASTMQDGPGAMAMVGFTLPVWRGRLRAGASEARSMVRMSEADLAAMATMIEGEVRAHHAEALGAAAALGAIRERVVPLTRQAFDATLASYAAGQVPLVAAVESLRALTMALEDEVMADVARGRARARLGRALGTLGGTR